MKTYKLVRINNKGQETAVCFAEITVSVPGAPYPKGEINHQFSAMLRDELKKYERPNQRVQPQHPFLPYVVDGRVYPRFEVVVEGGGRSGSGSLSLNSAAAGFQDFVKEGGKVSYEIMGPEGSEGGTGTIKDGVLYRDPPRGGPIAYRCPESMGGCGAEWTMSIAGEGQAFCPLCGPSTCIEVVA